MSLSASHVHIKRGGQTIVRDVSLDVAPGQLLAIAGRNGSGKSTLLAGLSCALPIASGTVKLNGLDLDEWHPAALARQRAVLAQDAELDFPFTVIDVVLMGRTAYHQGIESPTDLAIANRALEMTGLVGFAARKYTQLSGGERQRVHLARVLSQIWGEQLEHTAEMPLDATRYLMLDEPTASQDLASQHRVLSVARAFAQRGVGVICILHDLNQVSQYADVVLLLSEGEPAAYGPPRQVLTAETLKEVYGVDIQVLHHPDCTHPIIMSRPR
ncbi:MAG: heme ABC transporter ATP-binding protein [Myxococcota bacterium]|nr:heme ABC transporter ATP-binding protein [Myxococcota bacterium]